MRVIIVGISKVGTAIVDYLCRDKNDVIVIDKDSQKIDQITDQFDCNGYVGNGSSISLLKKVGIDSASLFISITKSDETNILCCNLAKSLGVECTIAAIRDPELNADMDYLHNTMGIDMLINPDQLTAKSINRFIGYDSVLEIDRYKGSDVEFVNITIKEDNILCNKLITEAKSTLGDSILVAAIERDKKIIIPTGTDKILENDKITLCGIRDEILKALMALGLQKKPIKNVTIIGGNRIGFYLLELLTKQNLNVTLIDSDNCRCEELLTAYPNIHVLCGSGLDTELMEKHVRKTDVCVVLTGKDQENLLISMYTKSLGVKRIATEIDDEHYHKILLDNEISQIFSRYDAVLGRVLKCSRILQNKNHSDDDKLSWLHTMNQGKLETAQFEVGNDFKYSGLKLRDPKFKLRPGYLIASIIHNGTVLIPNGDSVIQKGDSIIIVSAEKKITRLSELIKE